MDPVRPHQTQQARPMQEALAALEQAFAYYRPEPQPAGEETDAAGWLIEYYRAA
ncbi:hypothetical protein [Leisingera thetidis]|uniref:hypothetical protein n=1 Tax=Leisingera thetidis TaxID=2930199 RepID=UPI0021F6C897|nr:hypothetical protein [Leisingera thetidis]